MTYLDFADDDALKLMTHAMESIPLEKRTPFHLNTEREIVREDNLFLQKIMRLDPRDRLTASEILQDEWFAETV